MRLGDLDALKYYLEALKSLTALDEEDDYYRGETNALGVAIGCVEGALTVDAVPVVRCKDCKHWCTDSTPCLQDADAHFCAMVDFYSTADWFCAYGERREDDAKEST